MNQNNLDKLFQEQLKNLEATPNKKVWNNIESKLKKKKRAVLPFWWFSGGVAALLLLGLFLFPFSKNTNSTKSYNSNYVNLNELESNNIQLLDAPKTKETIFSMDINMKGSKQIRFIPIGKETDVNIKSDWKTANFIGEYLPHNSDKITTDGFNAKWKILDINRPFSQNYFKGIPNLKNYAFGVNFLIPVDEYQKSNLFITEKIILRELISSNTILVEMFLLLL